MKTLILCIDRDNDFGEKTEVSTPIIGREENLRAATLLGLADPEDSDTNSVLAAIQMHDRLLSEGTEVEVATVCGDIKVGTKSDRALSLEVESVLDIVKPDNVILVSDGAEDEYIYPIVSSRVKVNHVRRVYVKQSPNIESSIHIVLKTLKEQKFRRKVYIPLALVATVLGIFGVFGYWYQGLAAIFITLGFYLFIQAFNLQDSVSLLYRDLQGGILTGRISLLFSSISVVLAMAAIIFGLMELEGHMGDPLIARAIYMLLGMIWWFVLAAIVYVMGKTLEGYIRDRRFLWNVLIIGFSLFAMGFVFTGSLQVILFMIAYNATGQLSLDILMNVFVNVVFGISLAIIGTYIHRYIKEHITGASIGEPEWQQ